MIALLYTIALQVTLVQIDQLNKENLLFGLETKIVNLIWSLSSSHSPLHHVKTRHLLTSLIHHKMAAGLRGQDGDNVRDIAGQDYRPESDPAQNRHPIMAGRNVWGLPNNIKIVCFNGAQVYIDVTRYI